MSKYTHRKQKKLLRKVGYAKQMVDHQTGQLYERAKDELYEALVPKQIEEWNNWYKSYKKDLEILGITEDPLSDYNLSFKQIVEKYGFIFESHTVETIDGYLLELFRVRAPLTPSTGAPVAFL